MKKNMIKGFVGIMSAVLLAACGAEAETTNES